MQLQGWLYFILAYGSQAGIWLLVENTIDQKENSMTSLVFAVVNVSVGAVVSWLLSHYLLPLIFKVPRDTKRATLVTAIYTVASLVRNVIVYEVFT